LCNREAKIEDALLDFLLKACDIGWNHNTSRYERKNPYAKTAEIIQMALHDKDKERASKRLQQYVEKEWIKGHNDLDWKNAHKSPATLACGVLRLQHWQRYWIGRQRTER